MAEATVSAGTILVNIQGQFDKLKEDLGKATDEIKKSTTSWKDIFSGIVIADIFKKAASTVYDFGKQLVVLAAQEEVQRVNFENLLGDVKVADDLFAKLEDTASKGLFSHDELIGTAETLVSMGTAAYDVERQITRLTDALGAFAGMPGVLENAAFVFERIKMMGTITSRELRMLARAGIPAYQLLEEVTGTDVPKALKRLSSGALDATRVVDGMLDVLTYKYAGAAERSANTVIGLYTRIKREITRLWKDIGADIMDALHIRDIEKALLGLIQGMGEAYRKGGLAGVLKKVLGEEPARFVLEAWENLKREVLFIFQAIMDGVGALTGKGKAVEFTKGMQIAIAALVKMAIDAVTWIVKAFEFLGEQILKLPARWSQLKQFFFNIKGWAIEAAEFIYTKFIVRIEEGLRNMLAKIYKMIGGTIIMLAGMVEKSPGLRMLLKISNADIIGMKLVGEVIKGMGKDMEGSTLSGQKFGETLKEMTDSLDAVKGRKIVDSKDADAAITEIEKIKDAIRAMPANVWKEETEKASALLKADAAEAFIKAQGFAQDSIAEIKVVDDMIKAKRDLIDAGGGGGTPGAAPVVFNPNTQAFENSFSKSFENVVMPTVANAGKIWAEHAKAELRQSSADGSWIDKAVVNDPSLKLLAETTEKRMTDAMGNGIVGGALGGLTRLSSMPGGIVKVETTLSIQQPSGSRQETGGL